ncbi:dUTP diphosphatase [Anaerococcus sp. AGMB00486]|uniref:dUTP diphosphatase n=1 Tax=Anaerococcus faecalis TaxID=2742993 RepID=A0ABX2NBK9_9FIRM|nr:dUTP diphosphatase [Anaerococcus faecalis]NVF11862.1 dUTP diphosphatase [Anaerococcus faecalis]
MIKYKAPYILSKKDGDIGYDVRAIEDRLLEPMETATISTGVFLELDDGFYADLRGRSGNSSRGLICNLGLIDTSYRGEIKASITNLTGNDYEIKKGDRVGQLVFRKESMVNLEKVLEIDSNTDRGVRGFGSSGR